MRRGLSLARAASLRSGDLRGVAHLVGDLDELGHEVLGKRLSVLGDVSRVGDLDSGSHVLELVTRAAGSLRTSGSLTGLGGALKRALGAGARSGLDTRPVALGGRAHGLADGLLGGADSLALGGHADVLADGASTVLAVVLGATDFTLGLLATDVAVGGGKLLATELALRLLTLRGTLGGADGTVTVPGAVGEAFSTLKLKEVGGETRVKSHGGGGDRDDQHENESNLHR